MEKYITPGALNESIFMGNDLGGDAQEDENEPIIEETYDDH